MTKPSKKNRTKRNLRSRFVQLNFWNKLNIVLALFGTIGCILAFIFSLYAYYFQRYVPVNNGIVTPANESDPQFIDYCTPHANAIKIYFGPNLYFWDKEQKNYIVSLNDHELIKIKNTPNGLYVDATIFREDGRLVATIIDNQFTVNPNQYFILKSRDQHELRIVGKNGALLFYLRYVNEKAFLLAGTFSVSDGSVITINIDGTTDSDGVLYGNCFENPARRMGGINFGGLVIYGEE